MQFILQPWQLLLCILAGWMQREQQAVIEYLRTENQVLREHVRRNVWCSPTISGGSWRH